MVYMDGSMTTPPPSSPSPSEEWLETLDHERIADGFPGERLRVLPAPLAAKALQRPPTSHLLVTDAGFFPHAAHHWRTRSSCDEAIIIHCTAGEGRCLLAGRRLVVEPGQVLVIPPGVPHRYQADEKTPWTIWWAHVTGSAVPMLLKAIGNSSPVFDVSAPARVSALLDSILRRLETDESASSLIAAGGAAYHLLSLLAADRRSAPRGQEDPIAQMQQYLRENVSEHISVADLAAMAGFSVSHFSALFRRATGFGALEYQTRLRMSVARELLDTTDQTIGAIGRQVGYHDPMYFSRQFRRIHHVSPTQYRSRGEGHVGV